MERTVGLSAELPDVAAATPVAARSVGDRVESVLHAVLIMALIGELLVVFGNVLARSLLNESFVWAQEVSTLALEILTFVGGAIAYRRGEHMAVEAVVKRLPPRWRTAQTAIVDWLILGMAVSGVTLSLPTLANHWEEQTQVLGLRASWFTLPLVVGMGLLAWFALERLGRQARRTVLTTGAGLAGFALLVASTHGIWGALALGPSLLWIAFGLFVVLLMAGVPIGFVLAMVSLCYLTGSGAAPAQAVTLSMQGGVSGFILLAVPFFILAGTIMTEGGLTLPLAEFVRSLVGHLRGGLLQVTVISMYIFSGVSGAAVADVAAVGTTMREILKKQKYDPAEGTAVLAASAIMGETVPPSIPMLVLGSITSVSVGALFMAGLLPAVVMAACVMAMIYVRARASGMAPGARASWSEIGNRTVRALPSLIVPVLLIAGILSGLATPTEVSSLAVVYALFLAVVGYRNINLAGFWKIGVQTAAMSGMILFIISTGSAFSWTLTVAYLPQRIAAMLGSLGNSSQLFMLASIITLIVMGALLEGLPALLVFGPLLLPIATQVGIDPLQFSIVLIMAMRMGSFAPPIGVGFYVACSVGETPMERTVRYVLPYLAVLFVGLVLVAFVPWFSLVVPHMMNMGR